MVTQNKTWRFSKRIKMMYGGRDSHRGRSALPLERLSTCTETGEVCINLSKLREEHIGIWKNGSFSFNNSRLLSLLIWLLVVKILVYMLCYCVNLILAYL